MVRPRREGEVFREKKKGKKRGFPNSLLHWRRRRKGKAGCWRIIGQKEKARAPSQSPLLGVRGGSTEKVTQREGGRGAREPPVIGSKGRKKNISAYAHGKKSMDAARFRLGKKEKTRFPQGEERKEKAPATRDQKRKGGSGGAAQRKEADLLMGIRGTLMRKRGKKTWATGRSF